MDRTFSPPRTRLLGWLLDAGADVPAQVRRLLLAELFAAPLAVIAGLLNAIIVNVTALVMDQGSTYLAFILIDVTIVTARIITVRKAIRAADLGQPTATDLYFVIALSWCALQGTVAFTAMRSGSPPLQVLATAMVFGLIGPICARNFAAPRYAMLMVCALDLPFIAGVATSFEAWRLALVLETPMFLLGCYTIISRCKTVSVSALSAQLDSQHRASHDGLTGLLNRHGLAQALARHREPLGQPLTLFYLDLDGFKPVNDTLGHAAGDALLQGVAERLLACTRGTDLVARMGGDEFVVVAPGVLPEDAATFAESLIRRVSGQPYTLDSRGTVHVGVSVGGACAPFDGVAVAELQGKADAALYEAKGMGKGVFCRFRDVLSGTLVSEPEMAGVAAT